MRRGTRTANAVVRGAVLVLAAVCAALVSVPSAVARPALGLANLVWNPLPPAPSGVDLFSAVQQLTIFRSSPSIQWSFSPFVNPPQGASGATAGGDLWTAFLKTDASDASGHHLVGAQVGLTSIGSGQPVTPGPFSSCSAVPEGSPGTPPAAELVDATCTVAMPYLPGDTYQFIVFGGDVLVYDATFNYLQIVGVVHVADTASIENVPDLQWVTQIYDQVSYQGRCGPASGWFSAPTLDQWTAVDGGNDALATSFTPGAVDGCRVVVQPSAGGTAVVFGPGQTPGSAGIAPAWTVSPSGRPFPNALVAISWRRHHGTTTIRHAAVRALPPGGIVEIDCHGPRCPFTTLRGRRGHLRALIKTLRRAVFRGGQRLDFFFSATSGCLPPSCAWEPRMYAVQIRGGKPPEVLATASVG